MLAVIYVADRVVLFRRLWVQSFNNINMSWQLPFWEPGPRPPPLPPVLWEVVGISRTSLGDEFWDGLKFMEVYDVFYHALATVKLHHGTPVFASELDHARFALKRGAIEAWGSEIKLRQDTLCTYRISVTDTASGTAAPGTQDCNVA